MALVKDHMSLVQACAYNGNLVGELSSQGSYGANCEENYKLTLEEGDGSFDKSNGIIKNLAISHSSSSLSSPSSGNSSEILFQATGHQTEDANSLINFRGGFDSFMQANGSLLSFQQKDKASEANDHYTNWEAGNLNCCYNWNQMSPNSSNPRLSEDFNSFQTASAVNSSMTKTEEENHDDWLYSEANMVADSIHESGAQDLSFLKRPNTEESAQALKKQRNSANKMPKPKPSPSKDPQSVAAKNRRERISERLKTLQELVPNGSKVDLVTMLEKAFSYVKFLQLQVKVLATDEFWPVQGGKAPDISQVKEAIDAILSSQRDRNSSSSSKQ